MKRRLGTITILILPFLMVYNSGCTFVSRSNKNYISYKNKFDKRLIKHFPSTIICREDKVVCKTDDEKNDVGLLLYEYGVSTNDLIKLKNKIKKKYIGKYSSKDSCLLVVNRFETIESYTNFETVYVNDTSLINKQCYKNLFPIPHFLDYSLQNKKSVLKDENFVIFVLEAQNENHFKKYKMNANPQMPNNWKNGYSRGIAINERDNIVIYWGIIW